MTNEKTIKRMSDIMIECELRACWEDVAVALRHDVQPSKSLGDYAAALTREQARRAK